MSFCVYLHLLFLHCSLSQQVFVQTGRLFLQILVLAFQLPHSVPHGLQTGHKVLFLTGQGFSLRRRKDFNKYVKTGEMEMNKNRIIVSVVAKLGINLVLQRAGGVCVSTVKYIFILKSKYSPSRAFVYKHTTQLLSCLIVKK